MNTPKINVLLIEDDEDDYLITDELLSDIKRVSYHLEWVTTYDEALDLMNICQHDVYLVDYRLGPYNGLDLIREAQERGCLKPMILLTGQGGMDVDLEAMESGAADYLVKGKLDSQTLERAIRYAIGRYREQENLRKSEERYRSLFESTQEGIIISDHTGCLVSVNPAASRMLGYSDPSELVGVSAVSIYADGEQRHHLFQELMEKGTVSAYELTLLRKDGSPIYALGSTTLHRDENGNILRTEGVFTDITARIRAEQAEHEQRILAETLRDTAAILNSTLDINEILTHVLDGVGRVVPHDAANIMLIEAGVARVVSQRGYDLRGIEDWIMTTPVEVASTPNFNHMVQTLEPDLIPDTTVHPDWIQYSETCWIKSYLSVPILRGDNVVGFINLDSDTTNFFTTEHARRLLIFADQVSVALENASLYQDALAAAERRATLHQVSQEMVASSRSPERVYEAIHQAVSRLMPCEAFSITTKNGKPGRIEAVYLYDKDQRYPAVYVDESSSFSANILQTGQSILIDDLLQSEDLTASHFGDGEHIRSVLAVPMQVNGKPFGMIATQSYQPQVYSREDQNLLEMLAATAATTLESARLFDETQRHAHTQAALNEITQTALAENSTLEAMEILANRFKRLMNADDCFITIWDETHQTVLPTAVSGNNLRNYASVIVEPNEKTITASVLEMGSSLVIPDVHNSEYISPRIAAKFTSKSVLGLPLIADERMLGAALVSFDDYHDFTRDEISLGENVAAQVSLALAKINLLDETKQRAIELEAIADVSQALRIATSSAEIPPIILDHLIYLLNVDGAALAFPNAASRDIEIEFAHGIYDYSVGIKTPKGQGILGRVVDTGQPYHTNNVLEDALFSRKDLVKEPRAMAYVPLIAQEQVIGAIFVGRTHSKHNGNAEFTEIQLRLLNALADIAANSLHRAELHDRTRTQVERLTALHEIDMAISASIDLSLPFNILLEKLTTILDVDAASVMLLDPNLQRLEDVARRGFKSTGPQKTYIQLGQPHAGVAALERRPVSISDLANDEVWQGSNKINEEQFVSYYAIPLMSKGKVNGVLELFNRQKVDRDPDWFDFVNTLATQASIAINNTELFDEAQRSNMELSLAYDATIEAWSRTLELRDMETEGHSRRVTEMTVRMAEAMGIRGPELVQIRRGALLHDIGKMGVPDSVLFKPGPLDDDEWEIMRQHPVHAHELLMAIPFLRTAVDIPHYHHEKWDGSGYPSGLKREQIPLSARIFAVVDVWDALTTDRPYRDAWPREKVANYLQENSGSHFDPQIVAVFNRLLENSDW